jgi:hypothetical protein
MKNFPYSQLPSRTHIRLLTLDSDPETLSGSLNTYTLDECPKYIGLSYAWGKHHQTHHIKCSGALMPLRDNLSAALRQFNQIGLTMPIWIDAICINQSDNQEKSQQIPLMRQIYAQASVVYVWIGEATELEEDAFSSLPKIAQILGEANASSNLTQYWVPAVKLKYADLGLPTPESPIWPALGQILTRSWFKRLWILQEVLLSYEIDVFCGSVRVPWTALAQLERVVLRWQLHALLMGTQLTDVEIFQAMNILSNFAVCKSKMSKSSDGSVPISTLLHVARRKIVSNPLDRVYGILGLASKSIQDNFTVDYALPPATVYAEFIRRHLPLDAKLELFSQVGGPRIKRLEGSPSWCPSLDSAAPINRFGGSNGLASGYHAGFQGSFIEKSVATISPDPNILRLRGYIVDRVSSKINGFKLPYPLGEAGAFRMLNWEQKCFDLAKIALSGEEAWLQRYTRTLIANRSLNPQMLYQPFEGDSIASYKAYKAHLHTLAKDGSSTAPVGLSYAMVDARTERDFISTEGRRIGYAPPGVEVGDVIGVFENGIVPFFLRHESTNGLMMLVGEGYVDGLMYGEVLDLHDKGEFEGVDILIR